LYFFDSSKKVRKDPWYNFELKIDFLNTQLKRAIGYILKISIFILVIWYCYKLLTNNNAIRDFYQLILEINPVRIYFILSIIFLMMLMNWLVEALKWKFLCSQFQPIGLRKAIESVFCGLSWAVFTPNRIGEYGGRVLFLKPRKRVFGVISMLVGAISQMVITNVIGMIAVCWFIGKFLGISSMFYILICLAGLVYISFFLLLYFNIKLINKWLSKIWFLKKYQRFLDLLLRYKRKDIHRVFLYSMLRYVIFTSQYCILMQVIIPDMPIFEMIPMIFILFFVQSALPSLDLLDVGVRSVTASYFFGFITPHIVAVMAITACVWFVNLIIPAIIGSVFVFKINFFGTRNN